MTFELYQCTQLHFITHLLFITRQVWTVSLKQLLCITWHVWSWYLTCLNFINCHICTLSFDKIVLHWLSNLQFIVFQPYPLTHVNELSFFSLTHLNFISLLWLFLSKHIWHLVFTFPKVNYLHLITGHICILSLSTSKLNHLTLLAHYHLWHALNYFHSQ